MSILATAFGFTDLLAHALVSGGMGSFADPEIGDWFHVSNLFTFAVHFWSSVPSLTSLGVVIGRTKPPPRLGFLYPRRNQSVPGTERAKPPPPIGRLDLSIVPAVMACWRSSGAETKLKPR